MGTNYYLHREICPHCGRGETVERLHIGKSAAGWCFSLHVMPEDGINELADWEREWSKPDSAIRDEYGETITPEAMRRIIAERSIPDKDWDNPEWWNWGGLNIYSSEADFHRRNESQRGPNGLLRQNLSRRCVGHGAGTFDLVVGDFC